MTVDGSALTAASLEKHSRGSAPPTASRRAGDQQQEGEPPQASSRPRRPRLQSARNVSEELLLRRAQRGDPHAERLLIELHEPLARQLCRGFFLANGDSADLLQAARLGLWLAIHRWDPVRGRQFRPFAALVVRREVMMLVTASRARNQALLNTACPLHADCGRENGGSGLSLAELVAAPARDAFDPAEVTLTRERLEMILGALPALSEHERGSLGMSLNGLSQSEIGVALGSGAKSVNNALQRARRKLSAAL
jgi:RNA polymerase sporulation-specific sigma factor